jgi:hypothetical protein
MSVRAELAARIEALELEFEELDSTFRRPVFGDASGAVLIERARITRELEVARRELSRMPLSEAAVS